MQVLPSRCPRFDELSGTESAEDQIAGCTGAIACGCSRVLTVEQDFMPDEPDSADVDGDMVWEFGVPLMPLEQRHFQLPSHMFTGAPLSGAGQLSPGEADCLDSRRLSHPFGPCQCREYWHDGPNYWPAFRRTRSEKRFIALPTIACRPSRVFPVNRFGLIPSEFEEGLRVEMPSQAALALAAGPTKSPACQASMLPKPQSPKLNSDRSNKH